MTKDTFRQHGDNALLTLLADCLVGEEVYASRLAQTIDDLITLNITALKAFFTTEISGRFPERNQDEASGRLALDQLVLSKRRRT